MAGRGTFRKCEEIALHNYFKMPQWQAGTSTRPLEELLTSDTAALCAADGIPWTRRAPAPRGSTTED